MRKVKMKKLYFLMAIVFLTPLFSSAMIFVENKSGRYSTRTQIPNFDRAQRMKSQRKVGLGLSAAGVHGLAGVNLELNLRPELSILGGAGLSKGFNSFNAQVKRSFFGNDITPYGALGYAHWMSSGKGEVDETLPSFLSDKFLNKDELSSGDFTESLIYGSLGLQFYQLTGDWVGLSLYAEAVLIMDIDDVEFAPTFSIGSTYYF